MVLVKIEHLKSNSSVTVTKICDYEECEVPYGKSIPNQVYSNILKQRIRNKTGKDFCASCKVKHHWEKYKKNIPYQKSLHFFATSNDKLHLLEEFSENNKIDTANVLFSTLDVYLWDCPKCLSEYPSTVSTRTSNESACPFCHGKRVNSTNCMWTTNPKLAKLLANPDDGYKYTQASKEKVDWKCPDCGKVTLNKKILNVYSRGFKCSYCSDGIPYSERLMSNLLLELVDSYEYQTHFNWSNGKRYDFYIPSLGVIIETHGEQHYRYTGFKRTLEEEQTNDQYKRELAIANGILPENYIEIDCRKSDFEFIKNNIIDSQLAVLFDLNNVDWEYCHTSSLKSLVKVTCDLFNQGNSSGDISKILRLSKTPILKYLRIGNELGWCRYSAELEMISRNSIEVVKVEKDTNLTHIFSSIKDASKTLGLNPNKISLICKGVIAQSSEYSIYFKENWKENKDIE